MKASTISQFTTMSRLCLSLNNTGIELLRHGDIDSSLSTLVKALGAAKGMLRMLGDTSADQMPHPCSRLTKQRPTATIDTAMVLTEGRQMKPTEDAECCCEQDIYNKAFLLTDAWFVDMDYREILTVSVAVVFNLSLAHHMRALASPDASERDERLLQALDLYELAHSMQQEGETFFSLEFTCAIACNLGNIHQMRGDESRTKQCFQHLHMLLVFVHQSCDKSEAFTAEATETFSRSVCTLLIQSHTAPAA